MRIENHITDIQINAIVKSINEACLEYRKYESIRRKIFYEPYTIMRKKHDITSAVLSAFAPKRCRVPGFKVKDIKYGLHNKLVQPELESDKAIVHFYSNSSNLDGKPIKKCSDLYNRDLENKKLFIIFVFSVTKKGFLSKLTLNIPNNEGKIVESHVVYERNTKFKMVV